eukprot:CAMPEP_0172527898 /NCGR_PEP_ID=MMETSP1067-20121228/2449_1 /TAXON_ID=265564 ORGANISM="Thalassiosira punctigera, Strain Tpunct2005C2" /NCGR_SAMPLE_ID=MMETSP1067 /ASSEMBLY_ACC=CAM_ASM_000444 /LENGTH=121 /DNA_ID=CAMNT_0013311721 /DNA_START=21 /DNA_END=383 /DNA_ORIENTATION=-
MDQAQDDYSQTIAELHQRLRGAEEDLSTIKSEKAILNEALEQVQHDKASLSLEIDKVKSTLSQSSKKWHDEKKKLKTRAKEGDHTLVLLSSTMENVKKVNAETEEKLKAQLNETNEKNFKS